MRCALLLLLLSAASGAAAQEECSCLWQGSFAEVQAGADLVVAVQSLASKGNSVDFSVEKTLRGRTAMDEIRVWMQARDYCRPPPQTSPRDRAGCWPSTGSSRACREASIPSPPISAMAVSATTSCRAAAVTG